MDWSDSEHEDFTRACIAAGVEARTIRGPALGPSVGRPLHRLRSWPTYASLAVRGLRRGNRAALVAWQPLAGALAGILRRRERPRLVVLNPLLDPAVSTLRQKVLLVGLKRADRVLFFSSAALETAVTLGLERERLRFVPLGVRATSYWDPPVGDYFLGVGREARDWDTLAQAAEGLACEIRVVGPETLPTTAPLRLLPQLGRTRLLELMEGARAIVVPLADTARAAGQLTVLDAFSVGRAVIATRTAGTEDYVDSANGILVPPGDVQKMREALTRLSDPAVAEEMGHAALVTARQAFSLERFVAEVDAEARALG